mgnify:CR=1 FL=1
MGTAMRPSETDFGNREGGGRTFSAGGDRGDLRPSSRGSGGVPRMTHVLAAQPSGACQSASESEAKMELHAAGC